MLKNRFEPIDAEGLSDKAASLSRKHARPANSDVARRAANGGQLNGSVRYFSDETTKRSLNAMDVWTARLAQLFPAVKE